MWTTRLSVRATSAVGVLVLVSAVIGVAPQSLAAAAPLPGAPSCPMLPADNVWHADVSHLPVDANSATYIASAGASAPVHADFGSGTWNGAPIGIPYNVVAGTQAAVPVSFDYADESDAGPYQVPVNPQIEGGPSSTGDRHVIVVDKDTCQLAELYSAYPQADGSWHAGSGAIWSMTSDALRPAGWTSADAAGLPILPGLVRYDEVASGTIDHAIRVTLPATDARYVWPARHQAGTANPALAPMGERLRLKASFDISGYSAANQVILTALKRYGAIVADNGSAFYISGAPDPRWNNDDLHLLGQVNGSDFEAVNESSLMVDPNSGATATASTTATTTTLTSAPNPSTVGQPVTLTASVSAAGSGPSAPSGVVQFKDGTTALGSATLAAGQATWSGATLTAGTHSITASYSGDAAFAPSTSTPLSQTVTAVSRAIHLSAPNGGEVWVRGVSHTITWTSSGVNGSAVRVQLLKNSLSTAMIAATIPLGANGSGSFSWTPSSQLAAGTTYRIRITVLGTSPIVADVSDANFRLT
jgi:hypothetical protein